MRDSAAALPVGWAATSASNACEKIQDGTHFSPRVQLTHGKYRYVTAKNVRPAGLDLRDIAYLREVEDRFVTFGISTGGRLLAVAHTDRDDTIRIISTRPVTPGERKIYEEG